jgi:DNA-binding transcriptional MerR regulator
MRISSLARQLKTTPHAIRFYERHGLTPKAERAGNGYREYAAEDVDRLRILIGLRQLELPLAHAAKLAGLCLEGRCDQVSAELRAAVIEKRNDLARHVADLRFVDERVAVLAAQLEGGQSPRGLISLRKEERHVSEAVS